MSSRSERQFFVTESAAKSAISAKINLFISKWRTSGVPYLFWQRLGNSAKQSRKAISLDGVKIFRSLLEKVRDAD